ncbi:MAG: T9SS type A sorting domain-containing protein [Flavobacteriaceae bacterium]|nr:T9SS type A sorting domain-containing protein [Flavobacteriaceae bacterium]
MKKTLLICSLFFLGNSTLNAQTLNSGDIAFIGYHEDATDQFTWISLTNIPANEEIYFTDKGWDGAGNTWYSNGEGQMLYIAPAGGIACGTIIHINEVSANTFTVTGGGSATIESGNWSQSGGDQVLAYRGGSGVEPSSPVFIAGVHADYNASDYNATTTWNNGVSTINGSSSMLPLGLTNGINCVSLHPAPGPELDNTHYDGTLTGTANELRALINNPANWGANQTNSGPLNITASAFPTPSVDCSVLNVENFFKSQLNIFPNPISDKLNIKFAQKYEVITISIQNVLGQTILTKRYEAIDNIILNIKGKSGVYFVKISNEKGEFSTYKVMKK